MNNWLITKIHAQFIFSLQQRASATLLACKTHITASYVNRNDGGCESECCMGAFFLLEIMDSDLSSLVSVSDDNNNNNNGITEPGFSISA